MRAFRMPTFFRPRNAGGPAPQWSHAMSDQDDTTQDQDTDVDASTDRADDTEGQDQLGDAGKKALDSMKAKWQKERDERKARDAQLAAANAKLAELQDTKKDDAPDAEAIRKQARAEADAEVARERALDKVEAKAAKLFADPEDARALLAGRVEEFIDNGKVDTDAIQEALDDLLQKKPHLAAATAKRFQGSADGGARNGSKPPQLTRADLKRMSPKEIVKARAEGRLDDALSGK